MTSLAYEKSYRNKQVYLALDTILFEACCELLSKVNTDMGLRQLDEVKNK